MAWETRTAGAALLVLVAGLAGCIGQETTIEEDVNCNEETSVAQRSGQLTPGGSLSAGTEHTTVPAQADIRLVAQGRGTIDLVLTRGDTTVWEDSVTTTGSSDFTFGTTVQENGTYTLTASTMDGIYNSVELRLELSASQGC